MRQSLKLLNMHLIAESRFLDLQVHISKSASIKDIPRHEVDSERSLDAVGFDNLQKIHAWQSGLATHAAAGRTAHGQTSLPCQLQRLKFKFDLLLSLDFGS